jgi:hypothetical protein
MVTSDVALEVSLYEEYLTTPNMWISESSHQLEARRYGILKWGFAIPSIEAIRAIAAHGPVMEVMAGSGYWSYLLDLYFQSTGWALPCESWVVAVDNYSWDLIKYGAYHPVIKGDAVEYAAKVSDRTLLMVWPTLECRDAERTLKAYTGNVFAYVGELRGGCCATDEFFDYLQEHFTLEQRIQIPQWYHIHDECQIWHRKA